MVLQKRLKTRLAMGDKKSSFLYSNNEAMVCPSRTCLLIIPGQASQFLQLFYLRPDQL